jgi:hypothetical protein
MQQADAAAVGVQLPGESHDSAASSDDALGHDGCERTAEDASGIGDGGFGGAHGWSSTLIMLSCFFWKVAVSKESARGPVLDRFDWVWSRPSPQLTRINVCRRHPLLRPASVHTDLFNAGRRSGLQP